MPSLRTGKRDRAVVPRKGFAGLPYRLLILLAFFKLPIGLLHSAVSHSMIPRLALTWNRSFPKFEWSSSSRSGHLDRQWGGARSNFPERLALPPHANQLADSPEHGGASQHVSPRRQTEFLWPSRFSPMPGHRLTSSGLN